MRKYFYTDGVNVFGPFTLEELQDEKITRETKIWFQELGEWKPAGEISQLADIFKFIPPPIVTKTSNYNVMDYLNDQKPPKTWLVESILVTLFCCLPFGIAGIVNAAKVESRFYAGDFEGAQRASENAKKWTMISFGLGIAFGIIYLLFMLILSVEGGY